MTRVACQVLHKPNRVTFRWYGGDVPFEPYDLEGAELERFYEAAHDARRCLAGATTDPARIVDLAAAGRELYRTIFRLDVAAGPAREIFDWFASQTPVAFDLLSDAPGRTPWSVVYDREVDEGALRAGEPHALGGFWGFRYPLAVGRRVNPLRMASLLPEPTLLLAADADLLGQAPVSQGNLLNDLAMTRELPVLRTGQEVRERLRLSVPDVLYLFGRMERGGLVLGGEHITPAQLRDLIARAPEGNPDPIVFLMAAGDPAEWEKWECFVGAAASSLRGVVLPETPLRFEQVNSFGVEALSNFLKGERIGQSLTGARHRDVAALAFSAFCPAHVKAALDETTQPDISLPEPLPLPDEPYRPLAPFEAEDRALFTGREEEIVRCAALLDEAATRGLIVHGGPGVGKTSFLRAGLLPHLETESLGYLALRDRTPDPDASASPEADYPVVAIRPGRDLAGQLAEALSAFCAQPYLYTTPIGKQVTVDLPEILRASLAGGDSTAIRAGMPGAANNVAEPGHLPPTAPASVPGAVDVWRSLMQSPDVLARLLDQLTRRLPFDLVLMVDPSDDLVLAGSEPEDEERRRSALQMLSFLFRSPAGCKLVLALRTEFVGRFLDAVPPGKEGWRQFYLSEPTEELLLRAALQPTMREAIPLADEVPFTKYHMEFEDGLAETLVQDVLRAAKEERHSSVALLQAVCGQLHVAARTRTQPVVRTVDLKLLGGVSGALTREVDKRIARSPALRTHKKALCELLDTLAPRTPEGAVAAGIAASADVASGFTATTYTALLQAGMEAGLLETHRLLVDGHETEFVALPQDSLAQAAALWEEEGRKKAYARAKVIDLLWIVVPLMFLVAAITFWYTRRTAAASTQADETKAAIAQIEKNLQRLQEDADAQRWQVYLGIVARAQQALDSDNTLRARQFLLTQQFIPGLESDHRGFEWYYLWKQAHQERNTLLGHKGAVTGVAVSTDGKLAASAGMDGSVRLWDLEKGRENALLLGHKGPVLAVALSADGKTIASAGQDKVIRLWDATAGGEKHAVVEKERGQLAGHEDAVLALVFTKEALFSAGKDKRVIRWHVEKGKEEEKFTEHQDAVTALALSPDGKTLASGGLDRTILVRQLGGKEAPVKLETPAALVALAFSPTGKALASGHRGGDILHWDLEAGKGQTSENATKVGTHATDLFTLAYDLSSDSIVSGGSDHLLRVWNPRGGAKGSYRGCFASVASLAVSADGTRLVSGSFDNAVRVWDSPTRRPLEVVPADKALGAITSLAISPDNKSLALAGQDVIQVWNLDDLTTASKPAKTLKPGGDVRALAFARKDGGLVAHVVSAKGGAVQRWGDKFADLPALGTDVVQVAVSRDGAWLAVANKDRSVGVWDLAAGELKHTLKGHQADVRCLAFSVEGKLLLTADTDGMVHTWDAQSGTEARKPRKLALAPLTAIVFYAGSSRFVTASADRVIDFWVWNADEEPRRENSQRVHGQAITSLAAGPGYVVSASQDGTVKLFDLQQFEGRAASHLGEERFTFTGHHGAVQAVAVSPNGLVIASGGADGTVRLRRTLPRPKVVQVEVE